MSAPSVLERSKERFGRIGAAGYGVVLTIVVLAATGVVGLLAQLPWLFPSLGPTVMLFFEAHDQPSSRPLNTIVGHGVGILAARDAQLHPAPLQRGDVDGVEPDALVADGAQVRQRVEQLVVDALAEAPDRGGIGVLAAQAGGTHEPLEDADVELLLGTSERVAGEAGAADQDRLRHEAEKLSGDA